MNHPVYLNCYTNCGCDTSPHCKRRALHDVVILSNVTDFTDSKIGHTAKCRAGFKQCGRIGSLLRKHTL